MIALCHLFPYIHPPCIIEHKHVCDWYPSTARVEAQPLLGLAYVLSYRVTSFPPSLSHTPTSPRTYPKP